MFRGSVRHMAQGCALPWVAGGGDVGSGAEGEIVTIGIYIKVVCKVFILVQL